MTEKLLPCPFCGEAAYFERHGTNRQSCIVACESCGCNMETGETGHNCGGMWNSRAAQPAASAEPVDIEELAFDCGGTLASDGRFSFSCAAWHKFCKAAPVAAQPSVPDKKPVERAPMGTQENLAIRVAYHREGYALGWNACCDAMLAATPTPPATEQAQQDYKALYHAEQKLRLEAEACADMLRGSQQDDEKADAQHWRDSPVSNRGYAEGWKKGREERHDPAIADKVDACVAPVSDKPACGAQNAECERQQPDPAMAGGEWLREHEALMHRVSKAAIVVGYGGTINGVTAEAALENAEKLLMTHARKRVQPASGEDARDSARYRWLVAHSMPSVGYPYKCTIRLPLGYSDKDSLDAAIDQAMQQERQP